MPLAPINGIEIYYEEHGQGAPIVFSHEFAGDYRSWAPQVRFFARRYRTITYCARGYPPSSVPTELAAYSEEQSVEDLYELIRFLGIEKAHVVGLSMGGNVALKIGLAHPEVCASLVVAGAGFGSVNPEEFRANARETADMFERVGIETAAETYGRGPSRLRFEQKDPHGFAEIGQQRRDIASAYGPRFETSGFRYVLDLSRAAPGPHTVEVRAHSTVSGLEMAYVRAITVAP